MSVPNLLEINYICDEAAACMFATLIAKQAKIGDCFALYGDLGTGKSTFARAFIQALCGDVAVASPTFTISQSYECAAVTIWPSANCATIWPSANCATIWHYDLYRIKSTAELYEIGLEETLDTAITLIEWPEIAKSLLPPRTMHITFAFADNSDYRCLRIEQHKG